MGIVLNEFEWAKDAIGNHLLGSKPSETLSRVARYYFYCGKNKSETRSLLEKFITECDPYISTVKWSDTLDNVLKYASRRPLLMIDSVAVSKPEIDIIKTIRGTQAQRLAFTLLCIAKYNFIAGNNQEYWVSTPDSEIMRMANIQTSIKRQSLLFTNLRDAGLIYFSKRVDNLSVKVMFVTNGDTAIKIKDFRNLGYQYLNYLEHNGKYFVCENCGLTCKDTSKDARGRKKKYCNDCAAKIRLQQIVNSVMTKRNQQKSNTQNV